MCNMYANLKLNELLGRIDVMTAESIRKKWPEITTSRESARVLLKKLDDETLGTLFGKALEYNHAGLAVLSAEALINHDVSYLRYNCGACYAAGATNIIADTIVKSLQEAFEKRQIMRGSNMVNVLGLALFDECQGHDYLLSKYGQELSRGLIFMGPKDWFEESLKNGKSVPAVAMTTPWARAVLQRFQEA